MYEFDLGGVSETMLWPLHNRASEAAREDGCILDPKCLEIYRTINYDYVRHFGAAEPSHGVRSRLFDNQLSQFLERHPDGVIVNLGEGLETQRFRVDSPQSLWISVDVPQAMAVREHFISPDSRHLHITESVLESTWFAAVPPGRAVFITAQGLFMYFIEAQLSSLFRAMAQRFPGAWLMFDYLPPWLSRKTTSAKGWQKTAYYRTPPMPWGVHRDHLGTQLSTWIGQEVTVHNVTFLFPRGFKRWLVPKLEKISLLSRHFPGVCWLQFPAPGLANQEAVDPSAPSAIV